MQSFRFNIVIYVFSQNIIIKRRRPSDDKDPFILGIAGGCVEENEHYNKINIHSTHSIHVLCNRI